MQVLFVAVLLAVRLLPLELVIMLDNNFAVVVEFAVGVFIHSGVDFVFSNVFSVNYKMPIRSSALSAHPLLPLSPSHTSFSFLPPQLHLSLFLGLPHFVVPSSYVVARIPLEVLTEPYLAVFLLILFFYCCNLSFKCFGPHYILGTGFVLLFYRKGKFV